MAIVLLTLVALQIKVNAMVKTIGILILGGVALTGLSCSSRSSPPITPSAKLLKIDLGKIRSLTLSKDDSVAGDAWVARLHANQKGEWELLSGPHGESLLDRRADSNWVTHFLDTLQTLQAEGRAPRGTLASYGLHRPIFRVNWRETGNEKESELRIGGEDGPGGTVFAQVDDQEDVLLLRGAAIRMLASLTEFKVIRARRLLTFMLDEMDEVLIEVAGARKKYYQRQGEFWADAKNRRYRGLDQERIQLAFAALEHLRIETFPDIEESPISSGLSAPARDLGSKGLQAGQVRIRFRDRNGVATLLAFERKKGKRIATLSSRPESSFILFDEAEKWVAQLARLP